MTTAILTMTDETGNLTFWVDTRDAFGNLTASESFKDKSEADQYLALVG